MSFSQKLTREYFLEGFCGQNASEFSYFEFQTTDWTILSVSAEIKTKKIL